MLHDVSAQHESDSGLQVWSIIGGWTSRGTEEKSPAIPGRTDIENGQVVLKA
jgi:hypothetical protein